MNWHFIFVWQGILYVCLAASNILQKAFCLQQSELQWSLAGNFYTWTGILLPSGNKYCLFFWQQRVNCKRLFASSGQSCSRLQLVISPLELDFYGFLAKSTDWSPGSKQGTTRGLLPPPFRVTRFDWMICNVRQTGCPKNGRWLADQAFLPLQAAGKRGSIASAALVHRRIISQRAFPFHVPGLDFWAQSGPEPTTFLPLFCLALQTFKFFCRTFKTLMGIFFWNLPRSWPEEPSTFLYWWKLFFSCTSKIGCLSGGCCRSGLGMQLFAGFFHKLPVWGLLPVWRNCRNIYRVGKYIRAAVLFNRLFPQLNWLFIVVWQGLLIVRLTAVNNLPEVFCLQLSELQFSSTGNFKTWTGILFPSGKKLLCVLLAARSQLPEAFCLQRSELL